MANRRKMALAVKMKFVADKDGTILQSKPFVILMGLLAAVFLGISDFLSGPELAFSIFYLIPVLAVTWYAGRNWGIFISFFCGFVWLVSEIGAKLHYSHFLIPYWNAFVRLGFFLITSYMLFSLKTSLEKEKSLARTDSLTGASNARAFYESATREIERMRRYRHPFSVAYLDFDNFKFINDTLGHSVGDDLIRVVVETLNHELRKTDQAARLGGDEFAILMPETDGKIAPQVMERTRSKLLDSMKGNNWPVTFSIGLATFNKPPNSVDDMIKAADSLMYEAKNNGKNRVKSSTISPD